MKKIIAFLKKIYKKLTDKFFRARCKYIKYYEKLDIDPNAVLLEAQHGNSVSGNIYYIAKYLCSSNKYKEYKIYFSVRGRLYQKTVAEFKEKLPNVTVVMLATDEYFKVLASAKYLITDTSFTPSFIKKEGQVYLNTWHGTPLKTLGRKVNNDLHNLGNIQKNFILADYLLFPNEFTKKHIISDYMLENISNATAVMCGYPRNSIFFDTAFQTSLRNSLKLNNYRVYAYMPTYRGTPTSSYSSKDDIYLNYFLYELDRQFNDDEILYVNLHQLTDKSVDISRFKHIKRFPKNYETYEFLSIADCLITDYSSVFFDFANTGKKIILFPFDKDEYLQDRGMYLDIDMDLPFPKVYSIDDLINELHSEKGYDDSIFLRTFCNYDSIDSTEKLCDIVFNKSSVALQTEKIHKNENDNILIYAGNLAKNGITTSLMNLLRTVDVSKRNYFITFRSANVAKYKEILTTLPDGVGYIPIMGDANLTISDRIIRKLFKKGVITAQQYYSMQETRLRQEWKRNYGNIEFSSVIQFNGYENEAIMLFSSFEGNNIIYVHNDMVSEIKVRHNQRKDVLRFAYRKYKKVAVVTEDIRKPTVQISQSNDRLFVVRNIIDYKRILKKGDEDVSQAEVAEEIFPDKESFENALESSKTKFLNVGRFSTEKGQIRLIDAFSRIHAENNNVILIIIGGHGKSFSEIKKHIIENELCDCVFLVKGSNNPFPVYKKCDYFVLSSLYEGFGLVLVEANILGLPIISTDITGPRQFLIDNGGTLVANTEDGIYEGMLDLLGGKIQHIDIDYVQYNNAALAEFETLLKVN